MAPTPTTFETEVVGGLGGRHLLEMLWTKRVHQHIGKTLPLFVSQNMFYRLLPNLLDNQEGLCRLIPLINTLLGTD